MDIDVWQDNWIPRTGLKQPLGHKLGTWVDKVHELLLPNGSGWNLDKLNELFL
jgi:hypothetical protein